MGRRKNSFEKGAAEDSGAEQRVEQSQLCLSQLHCVQTRSFALCVADSFATPITTR
jgi:hypothetical protein